MFSKPNVKNGRVKPPCVYKIEPTAGPTFKTFRQRKRAISPTFYAQLLRKQIFALLGSECFKVACKHVGEIEIAAMKNVINS